MDYRDDSIWLMKGDCLERMKEIPDGSVDTILTDPPYFYLYNNSWDMQWKSESEYLLWINECIVESKRVLRENGTCLIFTSTDMNHKVAGVMSLHLNYLKNITWVKPDAAGAEKGVAAGSIRSPVNKSERILMFSKCDNPVGDLIRSLLIKHGKSRDELNNHCVGKSSGLVSNWLASKGKHGSCSPTPKMWERIEEYFGECISYDSVRRYFNPQYLPYDVIECDYVRGLHPCEKPLQLIEKLIQATSPVGGTVLDFTFGSGSTIKAAHNLDRKAIGIEMGHCEKKGHKHEGVHWVAVLKDEMGLVEENSPSELRKQCRQQTT